MRKKRLLVTASTFPRWIGDTEPRFVLDLCQALTEYYDVTVLAPAAPGALEEEMMGDVRVLRYHYFPLHQWETLCYPGAIVPRIKEKKVRIFLVPFLFVGLYGKLLKILPDYDIVHAHWLIPQGIVQSFFQKPYVVTGHGGDVTALNAGFLKSLKARCIRKADYVTVVSGYLKEQVQAIYPAEKIKVEPMGVHCAQFSRSFRQENYFGQGRRKVILFVGRLAEKKGVKYLIEAVKAIDAVLVIVGAGPLEKELKQQAKPLKEKVVFMGAKTHEQLRVIYASADVFVVPSVTASNGDKEGVPTVITEAFASGLPVVATRHSGIPELITDGVNGLLTEEKDTSGLTEKILCVLNDEKLAEKLAANGRTTAEYYDYKEIAKRYFDIYSQII